MLEQPLDINEVIVGNLWQVVNSLCLFSKTSLRHRMDGGEKAGLYDGGQECIRLRTLESRLVPV